MTITHKQALYIAIYLYKGIAEKGYRDVCISIAENAVVGFEKKGGNRFRTYVRLNNRYDKSARGRVLQIPAEDFHELADEVKNSIENSRLLDGIELNMSKVPNPSMEVLKQIVPDVVEQEHPVVEDFFDEEDPEETKNDFIIDDFDSVEADKSSDTSEKTDYISLEEVEREDGMYGSLLEPDKETTEETEAEEPVNEPEEFFDDFDDVEPSEEAADSIPEETEESDEPAKEQVSEAFMDAEADKSVSDTSSTLLKQYDSEHAYSLDMIRDHSYINSIMKDGFDLTPNVERMFRYLCEKSSEKATDAYINLVCHLVSEFDYNITDMSKETGVDRRDIMLAMMEKQFN